MILDVIFCALWCVGILALVWGLAGWLLLPLSGRQSTVLFPDGKEGALERQLRTNAWLRAAGLERGMVYVICDGLSSQARQEAELFARDRDYLCVLTRAQLCAILKMEERDMTRQEEQMIRGTVQSVLFQNPENGYSVLKLRTEDGELVTVVGTIPMTIVGERLVIAGRWGRHPSHGPQFEAEFLERLMPETKAEIFSFLSSRAVKGIGAKTAEKIVSRFGASEPRCSGE